ncbi:hypothetical protein [Ramlibacter sp.]|uniref:hypothetical protein n=1 Tax=Ramlibacter sp. TaxID=1917967 RepID=UPI003D113E3F
MNPLSGSPVPGSIFKSLDTGPGSPRFEGPKDARALGIDQHTMRYPGAPSAAVAELARGVLGHDDTMERLVRDCCEQLQLPLHTFPAAEF